MRVLLFILLCIVSLVHSENLCSKGCLNCSTDGTCNLCDFYSNMFLNEALAFERDGFKAPSGEAQTEQCQFRFVDNCLRNYVQGDCKECRKGYSLNKFTGLCEFESKPLQIEFCGEYLDRKCVQCSSGYILRHNQCIKQFMYRQVVTTTTDAQGNSTTQTNNVSFDEDWKGTPSKVFECLVYESNATERCQKCTKGHYITEEFKCRKYLEDSSFDSNCASVSTFTCFKCDNGYSLLNNSFLDRSFSNAYSYFDQIYQFLKNEGEGYFETLTNNSCIKNTIEGCIEYSGIITCKKCDTDYLLSDEKSCIRLTNEFRIPNCKVFLNKTKCSECDQYYLLNSNNTACLLASYIENCEELGNDTRNNICKKCKSDFYLTTDDNCRKRTNHPYPNCKEDHLYYNFCQTCELNHMVSDIDFNCIPIPSKCVKYTINIEVGAVAPFYSCKECEPGNHVHLVNKNCISNSFSNCKVFDMVANKCLECENKFYFSISEFDVESCEKHDLSLFPDCEIYSPIVKNKCLYCGENCSILENISQCIKRDFQDMCQSYDFSGENCLNCFEGFYLSAQGDCLMIDYRKHCLINDPLASDDYCWTCKEDYFKYFEKSATTIIKCKPKKERSSQNCFFGQENDCIECSQGSYKIDMMDSFICEEKDNFYTPKLISNCQRYTKFTQFETKCIQCEEGFALRSDFNVCVKTTNCPGGVLFGKLNTDYDFLIFDESFTICDVAMIKNTCAIIAIANNSDRSNVCIKCASTHSAITDPYSGTKHHSFLEHSDDIFQVKSPISSFMEVSECIINSDTTFATYKVDKCFEYYKSVDSGSNAHYGCLKCNWGMTGPAKIIDAPKGGLKSCSNFSNECDSSTKYFGLSYDWMNISGGNKPAINWDSLVSCHKCSDDSKIPFYFLDSGFKPAPYSLYVQDGESFKDGLDGIIMRCIKPTKLGIQLFLNYKMDFDFIENCGIGSINVESTKTNLGELTNLEVFCIACKPGYSPVYNNDKVTSCTKISNCDDEKDQIWFNRCSSCNTKKTYSFDTGTNKSSYSACQSFNDENCGVFNGSECMFCKKGFSFSPKGKCIRIEVPGCTNDPITKGTTMTNRMRIFEQFKLTSLITSEVLYWVGRADGCLSCKDNHVNVKIGPSISSTKWDISKIRNNIRQILKDETIKEFDLGEEKTSNSNLTICVKDVSTFETYTTENKYDIQEAESKIEEMKQIQLIDNCLTYSLYPNSNIPICSKCVAGFILSLDHNYCFSPTLLSNCELAIANDKCLKCKNGFSIQQDLTCSALNIDNCEEFMYLNTSYNSNDYNLKCAKCKSGFYSEDGSSCQKMKISNCEIAFDAATCLKCNHNYFLFSNGIITECRETSRHIICANGYLDVMTDKVACLECPSADFIFKEMKYTDTPEHYHKKSDESRKYFTSQSFQKVENCQNYKQTISSLGSQDFWLVKSRNQKSSEIDFVYSTSFKCLRCMSGYYLDDLSTTCIKQINSDPLCKEFHSDSNRCKKCLDKAYMDRISSTCYLSPNKEYNCMEFNDKEICISCLNNSYPVLITFDKNEDQLSGSSRYTPGIIEYISNKSSTETKDNVITSFQFECKSLPVADQISDCLAYDKYKRCVVCTNGKVRVGSKCVTVDVANCEKYLTPYLCSKCQPGYEISETTGTGGLIIKTCTSLDLPKCDEKALEEITVEGTKSSVKVCKRCEKNYFFNSTTRECVAVTKSIENCEYYNPDQTCSFCAEKYLLTNDDTKCQVKLENYYFGDQNCSLAAIKTTPICTACKTGFYLALDNKCKPCSSQGINSVPNNCAICSPRSPNQCLMCVIGYNMDIQGNCVLSVE